MIMIIYIEQVIMICLLRYKFKFKGIQLPKLLNQHFIPRFAGFIPGLKCENAMQKCYTKLANESVKKFDQKRFNPSAISKNE